MSLFQWWASILDFVGRDRGQSAMGSWLYLQIVWYLWSSSFHGEDGANRQHSLDRQCGEYLPRQLFSNRGQGRIYSMSVAWWIEGMVVWGCSGPQTRCGWVYNLRGFCYQFQERVLTDDLGLVVGSGVSGTWEDCINGGWDHLQVHRERSIAFLFP